MKKIQISLKDFIGTTLEDYISEKVKQYAQLKREKGIETVFSFLKRLCVFIVLVKRNYNEKFDRKKTILIL